MQGMSDIVSSSFLSSATNLSNQQRVHQEVRKQAILLEKTAFSVAKKFGAQTSPELEKAYSKCGEFCAQRGSNFYQGTFLLKPKQRKAAWAIHAWGMRIDDIVDGPHPQEHIVEVLDQWNHRLEGIFQGKPADILDEALADTILKYGLGIQPFHDIIDGMKMDLVKPRYENFDELYLYCYNVSGTVTLMLLPVLGVSPSSRTKMEDICQLAVSLGIGIQLTNILRDVGEDATRGRIYLPQDELKAFNISEEDIVKGRMTNSWKAFMKEQIQRARMHYIKAEGVISEIEKCSRWPVCAALSNYQQILDSIEANEYDSFTKRAHVAKWKKLMLLPMALIRAMTI